MCGWEAGGATMLRRVKFGLMYTYVYATFFGRKAAFASVAGEKVSEDRLTGDSAPGMFST